MDQVQISKQAISCESKEINIQNIDLQQNDVSSDYCKLSELGYQTQTNDGKFNDEQQIDNLISNNHDDQSPQDNSSKTEIEDDKDKSEDQQSQEEDNDNDDEDFDFDFEKIKQRVQARQSHLPNWFLESDKQINNYNNKVKDVQEKLEDLGQGLKEFEQKRRDHEQTLKEERRKYLIKKYQLEDEEEKNVN